MNLISGISSGFHDASISLINSDGEILYALHSERYSGVKNDKNLNNKLMGYIKGTTVFYEKPFWKNTRRLYAGQKWKKRDTYDHYIWHHWSHAAAAYYTRPYKEEPVCVVIDAIGEWDTATIWFKKKKVWSLKYPKSLGLFYSAITYKCGLKPNEDEYITMGMAAYGKVRYRLDPYEKYHKVNIKKDWQLLKNKYDLAASAQSVLEHEIEKIMLKAKQYSNYLCYGGGVALNCVANTKINSIFDKIWILPNPGDGGSSLGAAAAYLDKPLKWIDPYLGYDIKRKIKVNEVVSHLIDHKLCGVANGRAEYGPRALGNRSLLADPRQNIKNMVNTIKRRQKFRPFAPAILEEFADEYFEGPMNEYMQFVAKAKHDHKSVTHVDGTARVQIVKKNCKSILRPILEEWYEKTKCPMLLNTSLNIKGKPIVNDEKDAKHFEYVYGVKVF